MDILRDKDGLSNIRLIILVFVVLTGIVAALLYFPPIPTRTGEVRTSGDITFLDGIGNPLSGTIEISGAGISGGQKSNVNYVSWTNVPNARIYYNVLDTKSTAVNLRISGDSPKGRVVLENYGTEIPRSVNVTVPGYLVKYVEISSSGVNFADADISIRYTDEEVGGLDENNLAIYHYDIASQTWSELSTKIDANNNIASATVNSLSIFAVSTRIPQDIEIHDTGKMPVISDIKTYDEARTLKKEAKTSKLSSVDVPDRGELEVDALASKNVAVKLKVKAAGKGEIILDDFGKNNPVSVPLPGRAVKYVEIGAPGISFSSADITIRYTDAELNGGNENDLTIYHWNGASWDALPTTIDFVNKTLSATTTSLSPSGVATNVTYYLENNATAQSVGADGGINTTYVTTNTITPIYMNLLKNGTMGAQVNLRYTPASLTIEYELFRFYLPFNYSDNTQISANTTGRLYWRGTGTSPTGQNKVNVSLIDYNPTTGAKTVIGNTTFIATGGGTTTYYSFTINHSNYTVQAGNRLMFRINTTLIATTGTLRFYFNDLSSYINVTETNLTGAGVGGATYNLSGYVTNKSSGLPLNGATVQTNTSLTTTTNVTGYYNFTGLSNGTYMVNASLTGYATNSTNVTVSGANVTNANISLSPVPTYLLSGYVTNQSSGAAISGATVTTNTSQTTSTNATGFYNFTLSNGTYLITASKSGYNDNSTTKTVNGAGVSNVNITLTPVPPSVGKILVATNRYVVLDAPRITGATAQSPYVLPYSTDAFNTNYWTGKQTTIGIKTLFIDSSGKPLSGKTINFTIYMPNNTVRTTGTDITDSSGVASFYNSLDEVNFYGNWTVKAESGGISDNASFVYNWWGCAWNQGTCAGQHSSVNPGQSGTTSPNSPYTASWEQITTAQPAHSALTGAGWADNYCTICHQSYDGNPTTGITAATTTKDFYTPDVHRNIRCDNASCHDPGASFANHNAGTITIGSCTSASCHPFRTDISMKSTLNGVVSNYSNSSSGGIYDDYHTPNSTVPCIICHGPMHNITKPDPLQTVRNNNTEDSQCKTCHTSYNEHNSSNTTSGGVNCTLCHSDDVHDIQVFSNSATYINLNRTNPTQADLQNRGNCTNCHQNATFFAALEAQPNATKNYTGRDPPIIPKPLNHSTDPMSGALWNGSQSAYWDNTSQKSACYYCHGLSTLHSTSALGSISNVRGTNNLNQDLTTSRWCANCHYKNAPDYAGTSFSPEPPEIVNASGKVPATSRDGTTFANHSSYFSTGYNDSVCKNCHNNNLSASATSLNFSHNVAIGSGGAPNCIQCHNLVTGLSGGAPVGVNFTAVNLSVHYGINSQNATNWSYAPVIGACWACHDTVGNVSTGHPDMYKTPKDCDDCHLAAGTYYNQSQKWGLNVTVSEHYYGGDQIIAGNSSSNISSCINCHENVSEMIIYNNVTDNYGSFPGDGVGLNGGNMSFYHYGANRSDLRSWDSNRSENCSYCHQNTNTAFSVAMADPNWNASIANHSTNYNATNPGCTNLLCHNSSWLHNSTLTKPVSNDTFCKNCHGVGGTAAKNNKTEHKRLYCTECHANSTNATLAGRDIHPIKYLNQSNGFNTSNSSAVDCTTCHQNTSVDSSLTFTPPKIPNPLRHSDNVSNGSVWNGTQARYWINTTPQTACIYCHNDTKHNATPLGRILQWSPNYQINLSIGSNFSCADCHYRGGSNNYSNMSATFAAAGLTIPPNITNGTNWNGVTSNYYNHTLGAYNDQTCKTCHGSSQFTNMSEFLHNVTKGGECTSCHFNFALMNSSGAPTRYVNQTMFNASPHRSVSCENCHTKGHNNIGARKACEDCHAVAQQAPIQDADRSNNRHNITSDPRNYSIPGSGSVVNITTCTTCHDATLYSNATSTYGYGKTDCDYCHTYPDKTYS